MKYTKISQSQLNEIEELIRVKNQTISELQKTVYDLTEQRNRFKNLSERRLETIEELTPFRLRHEDFEMTKEQLGRAYNVIDDLKIREDKYLNLNNKLTCDVDILETTLKKAVQMLNDATRIKTGTLEYADLSNILELTD